MPQIWHFLPFIFDLMFKRIDLVFILCLKLFVSDVQLRYFVLKTLLIFTLLVFFLLNKLGFKLHKFEQDARAALSWLSWSRLLSRRERRQGCSKRNGNRHLESRWLLGLVFCKGRLEHLFSLSWSNWFRPINLNCISLRNSCHLFNLN